METRFKDLISPVKLLGASRWGAIAALVALWGAIALLDGIWLQLDQTIPAWDPADHLIGALNYWWTLTHAQWGAGDWWAGIWTLSSKYPPLLYISTAPLFALFGTGIDQAAWGNLVYTAILLVSVYILGRHLFSIQVGLWAAGLCALFPQFYSLRTQYFMDYPLTALVTASFCLLTLWRDATRRRTQWSIAAAFGVCFGLALLMKQTAVMFLAVPLVWLIGRRLWRRAWAELAQLLTALIITFLMILPWSRTNWLFQISAAFSSNTRSAAIEGDPAWDTLEAWLYYWQHLPQTVSYPLLIVPIVGLLWGGWKVWSASANRVELRQRDAFAWLGLFLAGAYVIWSAIANKDLRYIMPWLPVGSVILAVGLTQWPRRWRSVRWGTVGLAALLMLFHLFPVGGTLGRNAARMLAPSGQHYPYLGEPFPHADIIDAIIAAQPQQIATLGVLPSTPEVNQHNLTYFGNRRNFQVYARRMGNDRDSIKQDLRSLSWFLSVTRPQLNHHDPKSRRRQIEIVRQIRQSPDFENYRSWDLPDGSRLNLFHRRTPTVEVQTDIQRGDSSSQITLDRVSLPEVVPAGQPIPVTYEWSGSWRSLHQGLVLLTWRHTQSNQVGWIHDHGIGLATLHPKPIQANQTVMAASMVEANLPTRVIERTAMLPTETISSGTYRLEATYFNPETNETYTIPNSATIEIDASAMPVAAPELDWVTQLRQLAGRLPEGPDALDSVSQQIGRLNLYDPMQNYTVQAEQTLEFRLQTEPDNILYTYNLALARVLQRDAKGAIATFSRITELDPQNPYAYAYLAFVNLYDWRPGAAQRALQPALELQPNSTELHILHGVAALMRGNLLQAWKDGNIALRD
jgi:4-amino-4-deoxy-L-arabinose transferase-like glycosyltransferase